MVALFDASLLLFALVFLNTALGRQRLKRQAIPSTHVQVHSLNSNVSVTDIVSVLSGESRIDLKETFLNASIWSDNSELQFDNYDTFVNYTAYNVEDLFNIQGAMLHKQANKTELSMRTNRTSDGHTELRERLTGAVSLRVNDAGMGVEAVNGTWAMVSAQTWKTNEEKRINVLSEQSKEMTGRQLLITAVSSMYDVNVILNEAQVQIVYGNSVLTIDKTYMHMMIFTATRNISLDTTTSPFEVGMTEKELRIVCRDEQTVATLSPNTTDVVIRVGQYSKLEVDRGAGAMSVGDDGAFGERVNVTSMALQMELEDDVVSAISNRSHIDMQGNTTKVALTAATHNLTVTGGIPRMVLDTGNVTIRVITVAQRTALPTIVPPFEPPKDTFDSFAPVSGATLPVDQGQFTLPGDAEPVTMPTEKPAEIPTPGSLPETSAPETPAIPTPGTLPEGSSPFEPGIGVQTQAGNENTPEKAATTPAPEEAPTTVAQPAKESEPAASRSDVTSSEQLPSERLPTDQATEPGASVSPSAPYSPSSEPGQPNGENAEAMPTTEGFVIGQYGSTMFGGGHLPADQTLPEGLSLFATISSIDMYTEPTQFTTQPGETAPFPTPEALQRRRRTARAVNDALVMRLFVPNNVNVTEKEFRSTLHNDLVTTVRDSLATVDRKKRAVAAPPPNIDVDLADIGRDGDVLSVRFVVYEILPPDGGDGRSNHSEVVRALNELGIPRLSQSMHYPVVEVMHVTLDSSILWLSLVSAIVVFVIFLLVLLAWKFAIPEKLRGRVRDNCMKETNNNMEPPRHYY